MKDSSVVSPTPALGVGNSLLGLGDSSAVEAILRVMAEAHGLDISRYEDAFLWKILDKRLVATGLQTIAAYAGHLAGDREEAEKFAHALRINHSDFFRNPLTFALLEQVFLPGLVEAKKKSGGDEIRVWSAGCAAGQEAWSLAMLLDELTGEAPSYRIFATDLDGPDLALARTGVYSVEGMGNVRSRHLRGCFSRHGDFYAIVPRLRAKVDFSVHDLLDGDSASPAASIYGAFDLIFCCNLLFYYRPDARCQILDKFCRALSPGGYFVTGEAERAIVSQQKRLSAAFPPAAIFQKTNFSHR